MGKQNLTVRLDTGIIRKARVLAAQRGTSISELVSRTIDEVVARAEEYGAARDRALALLERGSHLGKLTRVSRDKLHERR